jgi:hypothetical protein
MSYEHVELGTDKSLLVKEAVSDRWIERFEEGMRKCGLHKLLEDKKYHRMDLAEFQKFVLFPVIVGESNESEFNGLFFKEDGKPMQPGSIVNVLRFLEFGLNKARSNNGGFSWNMPILKGHGSARLALDKRVAQWREGNTFLSYVPSLVTHFINRIQI